MIEITINRHNNLDKKSKFPKKSSHALKSKQKKNKVQDFWGEEKVNRNKMLLLVQVNLTEGKFWIDV